MPRMVPRRKGELTLTETADRLGVHRQTARTYVRERRPGYPRIKARKRGNAWLVREEDIAAFLREWPRGEAVAS